jgi:DNA-binding MarR family transcriptional regulator
MRWHRISGVEPGLSQARAVGRRWTSRSSAGNMRAYAPNARASAFTMNRSDRMPVAGSCTCFKVRRLARRLTSLYDDALARSGLTVTQYSALATLARAGKAMTVAQLGQALGMDRTTTSRMVNPLERDGLVERARGEAIDARARPLAITREGRRRLQAAVAGWEQAQQAVVLALGPRLDASLREVADVANRKLRAAGLARPARARKQA